MGTNTSCHTLVIILASGCGSKGGTDLPCLYPRQHWSYVHEQGMHGLHGGCSNAPMPVGWWMLQYLGCCKTGLNGTRMFICHPGLGLG